MLKYLIIPLADDVVSFCHYDSINRKSEPIAANLLKDAILWAMKRDLSVQFLYPKYTLSSEVLELTESIDHVKIIPSDIDNPHIRNKADIVVFNSWQALESYEYNIDQSYVIRTSFVELLENNTKLKQALSLAKRINIIFTDIITDYTKYQNFLQSIIPTIIEEFSKGHQVQLNILTDRLMLKEMNNCNAGYESLSFAPDGNFYICPTFWVNSMMPIGTLENGIEIKNQQLFRLDYAPICRECDSWQCKRCVWLNKCATREVNTPGHEQCVTSHIERNASLQLLEEFRKIDPTFMDETHIPVIDYLDPFDKIIKKQ